MQKHYHQILNKENYYNMNADTVIEAYKKLRRTEQDRVLYYVTNDQKGVWFFILKAIFSVIGFFGTIGFIIYLIYKTVN